MANFIERVPNDLINSSFVESINLNEVADSYIITFQFNNGQSTDEIYTNKATADTRYSEVMALLSKGFVERIPTSMINSDYVRTVKMNKVADIYILTFQFVNNKTADELYNNESEATARLTEVQELLADTVDSGLPTVTSQDNGKVLKVVDGAWDLGDAPSGLPAVTHSDRGKILMAMPTGPSTAEWQLVDNPDVSTLTMTTNSNGEIDLSKQLATKQVVGFLINAFTSSNKPDSYTYEVKYTGMPYGPIITVKSGGTAYANKSITFDVRTIRSAQ
jgi:hypothetical protein